MSSTGRRFLVLVRAGEKSLHRNWLQGGERNWDLVVSWYGDPPYVPVADEKVLVAKGWKWDVVAAQLTADPSILEGYEYVWVVDDDIDTDARSISRLFEISAAYGLAVSQPALTVGSYFSHLPTVRCPSFRLRYVDFVECMAPCLSVETLRKILPLAPLTPSGFGLDFIWSRLEPNNRYRSAIIDAVPVHHTRKVGVFLAGRIKASGTTPAQAGKRLVARFGVKWGRARIHSYAGIGRWGFRRGRRLTQLHLFKDYLLTLGFGIEPRRWEWLGRLFRERHQRPALGQVFEQAQNETTSVR